MGNELRDPLEIVGDGEVPEILPGGQRAMVTALDVGDTPSPNRRDAPSISEGRRSFGPTRTGTRNPGEWAEENWDIIAIGAAFVISVALGAALCVAYNVTAAWMELGMMPTPPSIESRPGPLPDAAPDEGSLYGRTGPSR
jgi:hypothetical protein